MPLWSLLVCGHIGSNISAHSTLDQIHQVEYTRPDVAFKCTNIERMLPLNKPHNWSLAGIRSTTEEVEDIMTIVLHGAPGMTWRQRSEPVFVG